MTKRKRLLILSDTPMWIDKNGDVVIYEPTLREIEEVASLFEDVLWLGFHRQNYEFGVGRSTTCSSIQFKLLPATGGSSWVNKIRNVFLLPYYFIIVARYIARYKYIHTRAPSIPAFCAVVVGFFYGQKCFWNKYAGNWSTITSPLFYRLQKWLFLKSVRSKVTINGKWEGQLPHVLSFENPCFSEHELLRAREAFRIKTYDLPLTLCFVGRLEEPKGVGNLLTACLKLSDPSRVHKLILAGSGRMREHYENMADASAIPITFTGALKRSELDLVYGESHIFVLPSRSEGFPKVLSEAIAFGCIPVVTNVSALSQYISNEHNGFLLENGQAETLTGVLNSVLNMNDLEVIAKRANELAERFTYEKFVARIRDEVFHLQ